MRGRGDEGPGLGREVFALRVVVDIGDGADDIGGAVEEDLPTFFGPGGRAIAVGEVAVEKGVEVGAFEFGGGAAFEMPEDALDVLFVA